MVCSTTILSIVEVLEACRPLGTLALTTSLQFWQTLCELDEETRSGSIGSWTMSDGSSKALKLEQRSQNILPQRRQC